MSNESMKNTKKRKPWFQQITTAGMLVVMLLFIILIFLYQLYLSAIL